MVELVTQASNAVRAVLLCAIALVNVNGQLGKVAHSRTRNYVYSIRRFHDQTWNGMRLRRLVEKEALLSTNLQSYCIMSQTCGYVRILSLHMQTFTSKVRHCPVFIVDATC